MRSRQIAAERLFDHRARLGPDEPGDNLALVEDEQRGHRLDVVPLGRLSGCEQTAHLAGPAA